MDRSTHSLPQGRKFSVWLAAAAVLLLLLAYAAIRPSPSAEVPIPGIKTFNVTVQQNEPGTLLPVFQLYEGDVVRVLVSSKQRGMLMVHGFPDMPEVKAGQATTFNLSADKTGRFSLHLHTPEGRQIEVAIIEIRPRN